VFNSRNQKVYVGLGQEQDVAPGILHFPLSLRHKALGLFGLKRMSQTSEDCDCGCRFL